MEEIISQIFQVGFFTAIIRIATPFVFATIGELFAERSGVLNLGIEGIMMFGAMTGFLLLISPAASGWESWLLCSQEC
jgi:nucleoside ABC transporter membrane protein